MNVLTANPTRIASLTCPPLASDIVPPVKASSVRKITTPFKFALAMIERFIPPESSLIIIPMANSPMIGSWYDMERRFLIITNFAPLSNQRSRKTTTSVTTRENCSLLRARCSRWGILVVVLLFFIFTTPKRFQHAHESFDFVVAILESHLTIR